MNDSYRYFENRACQYYPCHKGIEELNCLFCYCPLYTLKCLGNYHYLEKDGKKIKVCTDCTFPHQAENYDKVMQILKHQMF